MIGTGKDLGDWYDVDEEKLVVDSRDDVHEHTETNGLLFVEKMNFLVHSASTALHYPVVTFFIPFYSNFE